MANIFAIITAVALLLSAFLAFKNKGAYENEISERERAESRLATSQASLADLQQRRDDTTAEKLETEEETVGLNEDLTKQDEQNSSLTSAIAKMKKQVESQATKIEGIREQTKDAGRIDELAGKIKQLKEELESLEDEKFQMESRQNSLLAQRESTQQVVKTYTDEARKINSKKSFGSARVNSVFGKWGFVTLSAGESGGIVSGSALDVMRGGEKIAELRVRSVESSRASADVIPDTVVDGLSVRPGDRAVPSASGSAE